MKEMTEDHTALDATHTHTLKVTRDTDRIKWAHYQRLAHTHGNAYNTYSSPNSKLIKWIYVHDVMDAECVLHFVILFPLPSCPQVLSTT